jgi:hypothetical protein
MDERTPTPLWVMGDSVLVFFLVFLVCFLVLFGAFWCLLVCFVVFCFGAFWCVLFWCCYLSLYVLCYFCGVMVLGVEGESEIQSATLHKR